MAVTITNDPLIVQTQWLASNLTSKKHLIQLITLSFSKHFLYLASGIPRSPGPACLLLLHFLACCPPNLWIVFDHRALLECLLVPELGIWKSYGLGSIHVEWAPLLHLPNLNSFGQLRWKFLFPSYLPSLFPPSFPSFFPSSLPSFLLPSLPPFLFGQIIWKSSLSTSSN